MTAKGNTNWTPGRRDRRYKRHMDKTLESLPEGRIPGMYESGTMHRSTTSREAAHYLDGVLDTLKFVAAHGIPDTVRFRDLEDKETHRRLTVIAFNQGGHRLDDLHMLE